MKLKSILNHQSLHGRSSKVMLSWFSLLTPTPVAWLMAQSTYRQPMVFLTADGAMRSHMYTGDGPCMCLLVSFKHCFNQSRFNNHDQSQVSTQVSSNHDHCFNTGLNSTPLVQGAMVPTAKEVVEDEALPWAEPMEVVDEVLPWAETWQEEWQEGDEEGGSHGIHLRQETEEHKDTEAVVDLANEDEEEAEEESPEGETVHYYSAPAGIFVKIIEGQDGSLRRQEFVEDEEKWARANAAVRVWEFDFGRNTPLPALEMDVEEVPLEKDEEKDQQDRLKEKMKKKLGQTFLEKMKKKVAAERMAKKDGVRMMEEDGIRMMEEDGIRMMEEDGIRMMEEDGIRRMKEEEEDGEDGMKGTGDGTPSQMAMAKEVGRYEVMAKADSIFLTAWDSSMYVVCSTSNMAACQG